MPTLFNSCGHRQSGQQTAAARWEPDAPLSTLRQTRRQPLSDTACRALLWPERRGKKAIHCAEGDETWSSGQVSHHA